MDAEGPPSLPFGFVKVEPEINEPNLSNVLDEIRVTNREAPTSSSSGLTVVSVEDIPDAVVEVSIPAHPGSLAEYKDAAQIFGREEDPPVIDLEDEEQLAALARGMKNERAKVKKEAIGLAVSSLTKYIKRFGLRESGTPKDEESRRIMDQTIRREFLSNTYGGNPQELFSVPRADRVAEHGHRLFVCPMLSIHPWAPQMPGFPGLIFDCPARSYDEPWIGDEVFICIAGLQPGKWLYTGHYKWKGHGWLTKEEWQNLSHSVRRDWINYIMSKPWGIAIRMSIRLRRELGREPSAREVERESAQFKPGGALDDVTAADVMEAFNTEKEAIRISGLNCEFYDFELQREFAEKQEEWLATDKGRKFADGEAFKPKRKRKTKDEGGRKAKKRTKRKQSPDSSASVKDEEVSEYDADQTPPPPPAQQHVSPHDTRGRDRVRNAGGVGEV